MLPLVVLASLAGQVIWITGASSGIGENLAYILSKFGCRLVLSARSEQKLLQVKKLCQSKYIHVSEYYKQYRAYLQL